ncbi:putative bifunctional diguanylate cyclase/phosphodiesterase [Paludibacterium yongneupense]|uniref:putative bifunctional diguanylate cyclase/phosphodiesterase n=1 Tax=Paludibacterium yongneupense TaxID=400061 RepID=UPI000417867E|nr:EAL domain-containing protein [Paludibacterium yongneupense]
MNSSAEYLCVPESAAARALRLLSATGTLVAAAVWSRVGSVWHRLADYGAAEILPEVAALEQGRLPGPEGGALALQDGATVVGWLVWRGVPAVAAEAVAELLSGHVLAARLRSEQSAARVEQDTLLEISQTAGEGPDLGASLPRLRRLLSRLLPHSQFGVLQSDGQALATIGAGGEADRPAQTGGEDAVLIAQLLRERRPLALDAQGVERLSGQARAIPGWLGVPLSDCGGQGIGAVVARREAGGQPYNATEQRIFLCAARHIGFALERDRFQRQLEQQIQLRYRELEGMQARMQAEIDDRKRAQKLQSVLFSIAELVNTSLSLQAFLCGLHRLLVELVPARNCTMALCGADSGALDFTYCANAFFAPMLPSRLDKTYIGHVLHSGCAQRHGHPGGDDADSCAWLGVPLYSGHELLGVLSVQRSGDQAEFSFHDQEVLEFVANNIGSALARVRALDELQHAYDELESRVRERTSELDAANAQLQFDSQHDALTHLPNRVFFARTLRRSWENYLAGSGERFAVFFIDLDRFKLVNDTLGHLAGDHLLFEAGARIRSCLRHYDFMARLGGDEFAVLLFGIDGVEGCEQIAQRMVSEFERPIVLAGREVFTTASIGVVLADRDYYHKSDDLLRDADHAMYCTKQQGRHGYTLFNHELRENQADQLALETELRRALDETGQLIPYFQPFIHSGSGELVGFETLVRWQHPTRGLIGPGQFLSVAEESGLIMRLDRYMIHAACRQLRQWREQGRIGDGITLHINLSSANFHDPELVSWIAEQIETWQFPPSMLHLEITESALIDVPEIAASIMQSLHALGVRLALDDFGTGYSALSYLHRYRFDVLKIDQSFVADVDSKEESAAIVRAILALAAALGLDVVAEGVETASQVEHLRKMGCAKLQGFYFAPPAPADEIDWPHLARIRGDFSCAA